MVALFTRAIQRAGLDQVMHAYVEAEYVFQTEICGAEAPASSAITSKYIVSVMYIYWYGGMVVYRLRRKGMLSRLGGVMLQVSRTIVENAMERSGKTRKLLLTFERSS